MAASSSRGFIGSRELEREEAKARGLAQGLAIGCVLPSIVALVVLYNMSGNATVAAKDAGAPIEVLERARPVAAARPPPPRTVLYRGVNRTVRYDAANPFSRGKVAESLAQQRLRSYLNKTKLDAAPKPWDVREARYAKQESKAAAPSAARKEVDKILKLRSDQKIGPAPAPAALTAARGKRVFDASTSGKGFAPGAAAVPAAGQRIQSLERYARLVDQKCALLVGFYNSADVEMTREFVAVWDLLARASAPKFATATVDVKTKAGAQIAANATVLAVSGETTKAIGTPAILGYYVQGEYASPHVKAVLKDMAETGPTTGRAGKVSTSAVAKDAAEAVRRRQATLAAASKKILNEADNRKLAVGAAGCYEKHKDAKTADKVAAAYQAQKAKVQAEAAKAADLKAQKASQKKAADAKGKVASAKDAKKLAVAEAAKP